MLQNRIAKTLIPIVMGIGVIVSPMAGAFFTHPEGGTIAFSVPCISSRGPGFWTMKTNSPTPVIYLYPSHAMKRNYLAPMPGITTLGLVGAFIECTTTTLPPTTLIGRMSILYGTAFGF